jgi:uncharacterized protein (TIGR02145 family)
LNQAQIGTTDASEITSAAARVGGNITSDGGANITARGICWSDSPGPDLGNNKVEAGSGVGAFAAQITGLSPGTTYYARAYAINSVGTAYGNEVSFSTNALAPTVTTSGISEITAAGAKTGGNISDDGGAPITTRGVCWSTSENPTVDDDKTSDGQGAGEYTSVITDLLPYTNYFLRAYASNAAGTSYGEQISFMTLHSFGSVTDIEGNTYKTIQIGNQVWMAENLRTTKYNDGATIPLVTDNSTWAGLSTPAYCWFDNEQSLYAATYGALYNYYAVETGKLCPTGWHVPSDAEWSELTSYLGGASVAGGKMKETGTNHWTSPNSGATNESGFTAVPGGIRYAEATFHGRGYVGFWWSSTAENDIGAWYRGLDHAQAVVVRYEYYKRGGLSVRCLKD